MSNEAQTPREIDEKLATLHRELALLQQQVTRAHVRVLREAGASEEYHYGGRGRQWNMSLDDALLVIARNLEDAVLPSWKREDAQEAIAKRNEALAACLTKRDEIGTVEALYTGWSRFFVVTSSTGHIHSSMTCSTCYNTTTFGWLPHLSGQTEVEAVEACGPALCSVCFPSAPVEHQRSSITQQEAEALAQGKTIADLRGEKDAVKAAKEAKKAEKARKAVERAKKLLAKVETFYQENGGYDAVMAWDSHKMYDEHLKLPTTVGDVVYDDWHERNEGRGRYNKDPRKVIQAEEAR